MIIKLKYLTIKVNQMVQIVYSLTTPPPGHYNPPQRVVPREAQAVAQKLPRSFFIQRETYPKPKSLKDRLFHRCHLTFKSTEKYREHIPTARLAVDFLRHSYNARIFDAFFTMLSKLPVAAGSAASNPLVSKVVEVAKLIPIISVPFAIHKIAKESKRLSNKAEKIDVSLRLIEGLAWLGDSVGVLLTGLNVTTEVASTIVAVAWHFSAASSVLWLATLFLNAKHIKNSNAFKAEMNEKKLFSDRIRDVEDLNDYQIKRYFGVKGKDLRPLLTRIQANSKVNSNLGLRTSNELISRITNKNFSRKLVILSCIVNFIAMALILFTLATPVGYALLAIGAAAALIKAVYERRSASNFMKQMKVFAGPQDDVVPFTVPNLIAVRKEVPISPAFSPKQLVHRRFHVERQPDPVAAA